MSRSLLCLSLLLTACGDPAEDPGFEASERATHAILATLSTGTAGVQVKRRADAFWEAAGVGTTFLAGDWVQSGVGGAARIEFLRGGRLELDERALVVIDERALEEPGRKGQEPLLVVESGVLRGVLKDPQQTIGIRAPDGATARLSPKAGGGPVEYRLSKRQRGTEIALRKGEATVASATVRRELRAGQAVEVSKEQVGAVVDLLRAPVLERPASDAQLINAAGRTVRLGWRAVPEAAGYRVQLSRRPDFTETTQTFDVDRVTEVKADADGDGAYHWRVATRDGEGRYGEFSAPRAFHLSRPGTQDLLRAPLAGVRVAPRQQRARVRFQWRDVEAAGYRVLVTRGPSLDGAVVLDQITVDAEASEELPAGEYTWGAFALAEDGTARPLFVSPPTFQVGPAAPSVKVPQAIREWGE